MTWTTRTLGELASLAGGEVRTGPFGTQLHKRDYVDDPRATPVIMPKNIVDGRIEIASIARVDDDVVKRLSSHILRAGDIVLGRRGEIGRRAYIGDTEDGWLCGTGSMRISLNGSTAIRPRFLFYYLGLQESVSWLSGHAIGATMSNLSAGVVKQFPVRFPPLALQDMIVATLDQFDDLIENNRRRIEILAETVRLLYREWFVHFRFPGCESVEFVDSDVGSIPEGWELATLGSVAALLVDGDWVETKDQGGSAYRLLQVSNVGLGHFRETGKFRYVTDETFDRLNCTQIAEGDILISRMPNPVGRAWYVDYLRQPSITAVDVAILRPMREVDGPFLELYLNSYATLAYSAQVATGTTRPRVTRRVLGQFRVPLPPLSVRGEFFEIVKPLYELKSVLVRQNEALGKARDLVLPRVVSGELDVSELAWS